MRLHNPSKYWQEFCLTHIQILSNLKLTHFTLQRTLMKASYFKDSLPRKMVCDTEPCCYFQPVNIHGETSPSLVKIHLPRCGEYYLPSCSMNGGRTNKGVEKRPGKESYMNWNRKQRGCVNEGWGAGGGRKGKRVCVQDGINSQKKPAWRWEGLESKKWNPEMVGNYAGEKTGWGL